MTTSMKFKIGDTEFSFSKISDGDQVLTVGYRGSHSICGSIYTITNNADFDIERLRQLKTFIDEQLIALIEVTNRVIDKDKEMRDKYIQNRKK